MNLNLYLISRRDDVGHDEVRSAVIAAPTAAMARQAAKGIDEGDQSPEVWSTENAGLKKIGTAARGVREGVVHLDVNPG